MVCIFIIVFFSWILFGAPAYALWLGIHRFYVGKVWTGLLWLLTGGLFFIGVVVDFIMILAGIFKDRDGKYVLYD